MKTAAQIIGRLIRVLLMKNIITANEADWIVSGDDLKLHFLLRDWNFRRR